jgi:very-short-patch-repair endonuclease
MPAPRVDPTLTAFARDLRTNATKEERILWRLLSRYRPKFTRQLPIGPYVADLACRQAKLVVEIDGSQHVASVRDEARTRYLEAEGWSVVRFWNSDVVANPEGVAEAILLKAAECLGGTHHCAGADLPRRLAAMFGGHGGRLNPLPSREGRKRTPRRD